MPISSPLMLLGTQDTCNSVVATLVDHERKVFRFFFACAFYIEGAVPVKLAGFLARRLEPYPGLVVSERHRAVDELDDFVTEGHGIVIVIHQTLDHGTSAGIFGNREIANGASIAQAARRNGCVIVGQGVEADDQIPNSSCRKFEFVRGFDVYIFSHVFWYFRSCELQADARNRQSEEKGTAKHFEG